MLTRRTAVRDASERPAGYATGLAHHQYSIREMIGRMRQQIAQSQ